MKGYAERIEKNVRLEYVGKTISDLIAGGYTPMVF